MLQINFRGTLHGLKQFLSVPFTVSRRLTLVEENIKMAVTKAEFNAKLLQLSEVIQDERAEVAAAIAGLDVTIAKMKTAIGGDPDLQASFDSIEVAIEAIKGIYVNPPPLPELEPDPEPEFIDEDEVETELG